MKKTIIWGAVIIIIIVVALIILNENKKNLVDENVSANPQVNSSSGLDIKSTDTSVKEFSMTSFVDMTSGSPKPQYSLKEIVVNKGDKVRIRITVTSGMHDFKIDEYGIYADTQLNKESIVEFVADKAGKFTYYCTKPGHRQLGHFGTLKVLE